MKTALGLKRLKKITRGSIVTVGAFDGIHRGHKAIIKKIVQAAREKKLQSVVVTFDPHPSKILKPSSRVPSLISLGHRIRLIKELGVDLVLVIKFTKSFSRMPPQDFIEKILVEKLRTKEICVGENFYFGKDAAAGLNLLRKMSEQYGYKVTTLGPIRSHDHIVSSSLIRKFILGGDLSTAERLLGRPVSVLGTVVKGAGLATELGFATANINPHHEVIPPSGVYAVRVRFGGKKMKGVLNIGVKPTFYSPRDEEPTIEVHVFGFSGNLYGKEIEVDFVKKIRDERKFKSKEALIARIYKDARQARAMI